MIQIPSTWRCASAKCVCVEVGDARWLCHVTVIPHAHTRYSLDSHIRLPASHATLFLRDNADFAEVRHIHWLTDNAEGHREFCTTQESTTHATKMTLHCLTPLYHATAVTLCGASTSSDSTRSTLGFLSATLTGRFVCVGACVDTSLGSFTVQDITLRDGYRGAALVSGISRIRLNAPKASSTTVGGADKTSCPVGLDAPVQRLTQLVSFAQVQPGTITGVVVRGPPGCGVQTTVNHCLSLCTASGAVVYRWSPSTVLEATKATRLNIVVVQEASHYFPLEEPEAAKLTMRHLASDAARLACARNGLHPSVVVIALSHDYGTQCASSVIESFFATHIVVPLPDLEQRAALLASRRGGSGADCIRAAQTLVGRTRREVLAVAEEQSWRYTPPFKAVQWSDIGGISEVKDRLYRALVWPQRHPEQLQRFGITAPKGILLYGPPGCAKTTLVKALCSEGQFSFIYLDCASVLSAFVGESEQLVRDVFARAAQQAPCIVFFDEVEVIGGKRSSGRHDAEQTRLLSTLLTEMDGFTEAKGVCFIGATNVPDMIDDALLRPGRFDYLVHVPLPTRSDRQSILRLHLTQTSVDVDAVAGATEGFSGADLKSLCSSALLRLLRSAESAPETLRDEPFMTTYLLNQVASFPRTECDLSRITAFHERHSAH